MSLDYDITKCDRTVKYKPDGTMSELAHSLIWLTLGVDMGTITEDNYEEFYRRVDIWEHAVATMKEGFITKEQVKSMIGLKTNVPTSTAKKWNSRIAQILFRREEEMAVMRAKA